MFASCSDSMYCQKYVRVVNPSVLHHAPKELPAIHLEGARGWEFHGAFWPHVNQRTDATT